MTTEILTTQAFTETQANSYQLGYRKAQLDILNLVLASTGAYISQESSRLIAAIMKLPDTSPIARERTRADILEPNIPEEIR